MDNSADWIVIGRFGRTHGIKGMIKIHSFTEPRENFLNYTDWHAWIDKRWQLLEFSSIEVKAHILVKVAGFDTREQAAALTNIDIAIRKHQLLELPDDEYYWHQLIGLNVVNQQGEQLGKVVQMMATGANDVLVVEGQKKHLIPYLPGHFVNEVNLKQQLITVDWDANF